MESKISEDALADRGRRLFHSAMTGRRRSKPVFDAPAAPKPAAPAIGSSVSSKITKFITRTRRTARLPSLRETGEALARDGELMVFSTLCHVLEVLMETYRPERVGALDDLLAGGENTLFDSSPDRVAALSTRADTRAFLHAIGFVESSPERPLAVQRPPTLYHLCKAQEQLHRALARKRRTPPVPFRWQPSSVGLLVMNLFRLARETAQGFHSGTFVIGDARAELYNALLESPYTYSRISSHKLPHMRKPHHGIDFPEVVFDYLGAASVKRHLLLISFEIDGRTFLAAKPEEHGTGGAVETMLHMKNYAKTRGQERPKGKVARKERIPSAYVKKFHELLGKKTKTKGVFDMIRQLEAKSRLEARVFRTFVAEDLGVRAADEYEFAYRVGREVFIKAADFKRAMAATHAQIVLHLLPSHLSFTPRHDLPHSAIHCGSLERMTTTLHSWGSHYFALMGDELREYATEDSFTDDGRVTSRWPIAKVINHAQPLETLSDYGKEDCTTGFYVTLLDRRRLRSDTVIQLVFAADSTAERNRWVSAINSLAHKFNSA